MEYSLGKVIRDARIARGLSATDVALFSNAFIHDYFKLEDDYRYCTVSADSMVLIAYLLELPMERFIRDYVEVSREQRDNIFEKKLRRLYHRTCLEKEEARKELLKSSEQLLEHPNH